MNKRIELNKVLPLDTPFSVHIFPSYYCNFHCSYCLHSLSSGALKKRNFKRQYMSMDIFIKSIEGLKGFNNKLKTIIFAGHGEPLFHKEITQMVKIAKQANVSERVEIVTNASLLTKKISDELIDHNIDLIRVSLQGVTDDMYKKVGGTNYLIKDIISNLTYFYQNKKNTKVHIKIVNIALRNEDEKELYFKLFNNIGDEVTIEYIIPFINEIDHTNITDDLSKCKLGHTIVESKICSMPFYMLAIEPNGNIVPCCSSVVPYIYGNVNEDNIKDIWESKKLNNFLYLQLEDMTKNKICNECSVPKYGLQQGDYLDNYKKELLNLYKERKCQL